MQLICSTWWGARIWVAFAATAAVYGQVHILTWHNDYARTGQNLQETILTPANVNVSTFGKLFVIGVDGKVDAQPLYVSALAIAGQGTHNVLFVVTEHETAYAFDADTGAQLWRVSLLGTNRTPSDDRGCAQVTPEIGITSTPAIDLQRGPAGTMYVVAMSKDTAANYHQRLHALDVTNGLEEFGGPVEVRATYPGSGQVDGGTVVDSKAAESFGRLLSVERPDVVFTQWPIDTHLDHQAASTLTFRAWLSAGRGFELYYYEVNLGSQTMDFHPTDYVDITAVREKKKAALFAHKSQNGEEIYRAHHEPMENLRGREAGTAAAEAFVHLARINSTSRLPGLGL